MGSAPIVDVMMHPEVLAGASCAFGVFDGFHKGHRFIVERANEAARLDGCPMAVLTFDIDPDELFKQEGLHKLMSNEERLERLASSGADAVAVLHFTQEVAAWEPGRFLESVLGTYTPSSMHVGIDLRFGARAAGTTDTLDWWGADHGMQVRTYGLLEIDGAPVTSTRIRSLLEAGRIEEAQRLM